MVKKSLHLAVKKNFPELRVMVCKQFVTKAKISSIIKIKLWYSNEKNKPKFFEPPEKYLILLNHRFAVSEILQVDCGYLGIYGEFRYP